MLRGRRGRDRGLRDKDFFTEKTSGISGTEPFPRGKWELGTNIYIGRSGMRFAQWERYDIQLLT